jgi:hypothetical protein
MNMENSSGTQTAETSPEVDEIKVSHSSNTPLERTMTSSRAQEPLMKRLIRWICPDQRVANRHTMPPLTAWLGMVRTSKEYKVGDVSVAGFYMITEDRWIPGTSFPVTLERTDEAGMGRSLTVQATVVRSGDDGVGFTFVQNSAEESGDGSASANNRVDLTKLAQFLKGLPLDVSTSDQLERAS